MLYVLYFIFAAAIAAGDQFFKFWIVENIEMFGYMKLIPGVVHLTHIHNTGAAFSMLADMRWLLIGVSAAAVVVIAVYIIKAELGVLGKLSAAAVLGGAIGNLIDRAMLGYVVDMFEVEFMEYAIFNVADCFIVVGGIVFVICYIAQTVREEKAAKELGGKKLESMRMPELDRLKNSGESRVEESIVSTGGEEQQEDVGGND